MVASEIAIYAFSFNTTNGIFTAYANLKLLGAALVAAW
jgi:hypothetical protein